MKYLFFTLLGMSFLAPGQQIKYYPDNTLDEEFFKVGSAKRVGGFYVGMSMSEIITEANKRRLTALVHNTSNKYTDYVLPTVSIYNGYDCSTELLLQLTMWGIGTSKKVHYIDVVSGRFTTPSMNRPGMGIKEFVVHNKLKNPTLQGSDMMSWIGETIEIPGASFKYYFRHFDDRQDSLLKAGKDHDTQNNFVEQGYLVLIRLE